VSFQNGFLKLLNASKEKEFFGEYRLSNAKMMALTRQSVGQNKAGDIPALLRLQTLNENSTEFASHHAARE